MPGPISRNKQHLLSGAASAALLTFIVYLTAYPNGFVDLDDLGYIVDNRHIDTLNWQTIRWAFTRFHEANWHPLTMLSLAIDRQLWGLNPFGFHLTNILLHSATVFCSSFVFAVILRLVFQSKVMEGAEARLPDQRAIVGGSIAAALFFGLHPLRVESVVWASERKDVLCLFFMTAAIWAYLGYAGERAPQPGASCVHSRRYWLVLFLSALSLLSKPTAVSLPLILLILDWYPLGRLADGAGNRRVVPEKVPIFLMAAGTAVMTMRAQKIAMVRAPHVDFPSRFLIACKALVFYIWKTLWPVGLAPFYPHPGNVATTAPGAFLPYVAGVATISALAYIVRSRAKMWLALWLFYVVTLAPMLGIVQVGGQWMADRYSYLPALGISLLGGGGVAWLVDRLWKRGKRRAAYLVVSLAVCLVVADTVVTVRQIRFWRNTETLATREIDLEPGQTGAAYYSRARFRKLAGNYDGALADIDEALDIALHRGLKEKYTEIAMAEADILQRMGRLEEALGTADWALRVCVGTPPSAYTAFREQLAERIARERGSTPPTSGKGPIPHAEELP